MFFNSKLIDALCVANVKLFVERSFWRNLPYGGHLLIEIHSCFLLLPFFQSLVLNFQKLRMRFHSFCSAKAHSECEDLLLCIVEVFICICQGDKVGSVTYTCQVFGDGTFA